MIGLALLPSISQMVGERGMLPAVPLHPTPMSEQIPPGTSTRPRKCSRLHKCFDGLKTYMQMSYFISQFELFVITGICNKYICMDMATG